MKPSFNNVSIIILKLSVHAEKRIGMPTIFFDVLYVINKATKGNTKDL